MKKTALGPQTLMYPMPALLIGSSVEGRPSFATVAYGGIANSDPPMVSVSLRHPRHTLKGIKENMTFSVNIPSIDQARETDYCGIVTGAKVNKADVCGFKIIYGKLNTAPIIEQCPVSLECSVVQLIDLGSHMMVIGRIEETYVCETCLSDGKADALKVRPIVYVSGTREYRCLGDFIGQAHSIGKELAAK
ncbi:MAG: flavin reductase family protein [Chloroflexi bacterium]|nr:flavin reductase family protein [Chloroflexota bacterium]